MTFAQSRLKQQIIMAFLATLAVFLLVFEVIIGLNLGKFPWLNTLDWLISVAFFADYFLHRHYTTHVKNQFFNHHWFDLLAAIPLSGSIGSPLIATHLFYGLTLMHVLRLARLILRIRILLEASHEFTHHSYLIYVGTTVTFVIISGAAGFYWFEFGANPNIHNFSDAVWWAIVTTTTIGYGDIYPVTMPGRIIATFVMFIGIATLGTFIALIQAFIMSQKKEN